MLRLTSDPPSSTSLLEQNPPATSMPQPANRYGWLQYRQFVIQLKKLSPKRFKGGQVVTVMSPFTFVWQARRMVLSLPM
jgi:hypothetical protein